MRFQKPALLLDDQLALLERRGLQVADRDSAKHLLAHGNYYRLRGYWLPLEDPGSASADDHRFKPGATFEQIVALYRFDESLRALVMEAVARVEVSVRTQFAYQVATVHGSHAYLDQALFHDPLLHAKCLDSLKEEVERSHEIFIKHYLTKYIAPPLPPLWAACEVMSMGSLSKWYANLDARADRKRIADVYDIDEVTLTSFLHHATLLRNICAHHARLWNRRFTVTMKIPRTRPVGVARAFQSEGDAGRRLYNSLTMLGHLMGVIARPDDWLGRVAALVRSDSGVDPAAMGFPADWGERPLWRHAK